MSDPSLAVILAGGRGERLGGVDKASLEVEGRSLLQRALQAVAAAAEVVVVGPVDPAGGGLPDGVIVAREEPAGGGPAAGFLAGLDAARGRHARVAVLAVDMPYVVPATFARLLGAVGPGVDGAVLAGPDGRRQLCAVLSVDRVRAVAPQRSDGLPWRRLLEPLTLVDVPAEQHAGRSEAHDIDTWRDL